MTVLVSLGRQENTSYLKTRKLFTQLRTRCLSEISLSQTLEVELYCEIHDTNRVDFETLSPS